ncbi:unannotated protein [freshwater metagenome]|uniref:Unannotated protein n=1 Tax=freshwater metagenome TaxID=449393 RepID=A0A6J6AIX7_9ZZZZ
MLIRVKVLLLGNEIVTGLSRSVVVPSPRRPPPFEPHAYAEPLAATAKDVLHPLEIEVAFATPATLVGVVYDICQLP